MPSKFEPTEAEPLRGLGLQLVINATAALAAARAAWEAEIVQIVGVEGRSARQVSLAAGVSHQTINNILHRHGYE